MSDFFFPNIPNEIGDNVAMLMKIAEAQPGYFEADDCPYSDEFKAVMIALLSKKVASPAKPVEPEAPIAQGDKWQQLEVEASKLFKQLKDSYDKIEDQEVAERMSYFRTATSLLEKLVGLQERAAGLKQMSEFQNMVISFLDDIATADQRTELMTRLAKVQLSEGATSVKQEIESVVEAGRANNDDSEAKRLASR